jgi:hypothetical protein
LVYKPYTKFNYAKPIGYEIQQAKYNCYGKTVSIGADTEYEANGTTIASATDTSFNQPQPIIPDSIADGISTMVCKMGAT